MDVRTAVSAALGAELLSGCAAGQEQQGTAPAPASSGPAATSSATATLPSTPTPTPTPTPTVRTVAVPARGSVEIPLTADIPGAFEVELHDSGKVLFQLRVA